MSELKMSNREAAAVLAKRIWLEALPEGDGCLRHSRKCDFATLDGHRFKIGALIWAMFNGPMAHDWQVWRTCGTPGCIQPLHIAAGTAQACGQFGYAVSTPYHHAMAERRLEQHRARSTR